MIRLDSNMQWSLATARRVLREIEPYNIRNYEDPVATFEEMAALRKHSSISFSSHVPDLRRAVALGVPDTLVTNFAVLGGIARAMRFIGACEVMGVGFWCYSGDAGICTAAYLHVTAALQWIHEPSQSLLRWQIGDVIQGGPFKPKNNVVRGARRPGAGRRAGSRSARSLASTLRGQWSDGSLLHAGESGALSPFASELRSEPALCEDDEGTCQPCVRSDRPTALEARCESDFASRLHLTLPACSRLRGLYARYERGALPTS